MLSRLFGAPLRVCTILFFILSLAGCGGGTGSDSRTAGSGQSAAKTQTLASELTFPSTSTTTIVVKHTGMCLDVVGGTGAVDNGAGIDQSACDRASNQSWTLRDAGGGKYQILAQNSGKCLDVPSGVPDNGTRLQQWDCAPGDKQLWTLQPQAEGYYKIVSVATGKCVDVAGQATNDGQPVQEWDCLDQDNQRWKLQVPNASTTTVVAKHDGKCMEIAGGATATQNGAQTDQLTCNGQTNQSWTFRDAGNGKYQIYAKNSGKCLDVPSGAIDNGIALQQWDCAPGNKQLWTLQSQGQGYYKIISVASGKCVDVAGQLTDDGRIVQQWDCLDQDNQRWLLQPPSSVATTVIAKHSGKCLDVKGGPTATQNGATTDQLSCDGEANQSWSFEDNGSRQYHAIASHSGKCLAVPGGSSDNGIQLQQWDCANTPEQLWTLQSEGNGYYKIISVASGKCVDVAGQLTDDSRAVQQWDCLDQDNQRWMFAPPAGSSSPPPEPGPHGQEGSLYSIVFNEDFSKGLDPTVWNDHAWYDSTINPVNYAVVKDPNAAGNVLRIWPYADASGTPHFFNRELNTDGTIAPFSYGYFEMYAKLPIGKGVWPGFWLLNHDDSINNPPLRPELDVVEAFPGHGPNPDPSSPLNWGTGDMNFHPIRYDTTIWKDGNDYQQGISTGTSRYPDYSSPGIDLSAGFHWYGLKWEPNQVTFYFDGNPVYTMPVTMSTDHMYLIMNIWFESGDSAPSPADTPTVTDTGATTALTPGGNFFEIKYVRAWKFK